MSFNIKKFKAPPIEAAFQHGGETLNLKIDADVITTAFLNEIRQLVRGENADDSEAAQIDANVENASYMARTLTKIIVDWDAEDEKGKRVAPTFEFFMELPVGMLAELFAFCMEAIVPKKKTAPISGASTSPAEN